MEVAFVTNFILERILAKICRDVNYAFLIIISKFQSDYFISSSFSSHKYCLLLKECMEKLKLDRKLL